MDNPRRHNFTATSRGSVISHNGTQTGAAPGTRTYSNTNTIGPWLPPSPRHCWCNNTITVASGQYWHSQCPALLLVLVLHGVLGLLLLVILQPPPVAPPFAVYQARPPSDLVIGGRSANKGTPPLRPRYC
eukprot:157261-Rhodomonas_salina.1